MTINCVQLLLLLTFIQLTEAFSDCFSCLCRHLNWTLKSLKLCYARNEEHLPLKSFTPELSFPHSSLELLLEGSWTAGNQPDLKEFHEETKIVSNVNNNKVSSFFCYRWTSSLPKSPKNHLCELSEDNPTGEDKAHWPSEKTYDDV